MNDKPMTPSEMGRKSRAKLRERLAPNELKEHYRRLQVLSTASKKAKKAATI